jgi:hypothetical protein
LEVPSFEVFQFGDLENFKLSVGYLQEICSSVCEPAGCDATELLAGTGNTPEEPAGRKTAPSGDKFTHYATYGNVRIKPTFMLMRNQLNKTATWRCERCDRILYFLCRFQIIFVPK